MRGIMKQQWKYLSAIASCIIVLALTMIGRAGIISCIIFPVLLVGIWITEHKNSTVVTKYLLLLLLSYSCYFYNDLMAIGKCTITLQVVGILNLLLYMTVIVIFATLFSKWKITLWIPTLLFLLLGVINAVIKAIRSTPISGGDIFSVKTAMTVAGSYALNFDKEFILKTMAGLCFLIGILFFVLVFLVKKRKEVWIFNIKERSVMGIFSITFWILLISTNSIISLGGVKADYWSHETNGFAYNLYLQLKEVVISEPENYDAVILAEQLSQYSSDEAKVKADYPNIIAIMNESFADLEVLGEFETNQEVLPVLYSMKDNTIKGNLYVSVYGGNTANSEYEFLTGNSIEYFSERVVPYQLYIHEAKSNLFTQMKDLGYETIFMHPYGSYGWNRVSVYNYFGADRIYFEEDMEDLTHIRQFATDSSQYEIVKNILEEGREKPVFIFDVTVQNHGGYTGTMGQLESKIQLKETAYEEVSNYLNLVHESDRALGEFLEFLKTYEEPTVVIFFGDHQPAIEEEFVEELTGYEFTTMPEYERQKLYTTPYFIWANYDLQEKKNVDMSLNYLSAYVMQTLDLPMTGHQKYLMDLYKEYPVINTVGMIDFGNSHISYQEMDGKARKEIDIYNNIIYNYMFDGGSIEHYYELK